MPRNIRKVRLMHATVTRTNLGAMNGGWTTTLSDKTWGDWAQIDPRRSPVALACHEYECYGRLAVHLNTPAERSAFLRRSRKRRVKKLGVAAGVVAVGALIQLAGLAAVPVLFVPGTILSCVGSLACIVLLLMLVFGGRMPRHTTKDVSGLVPPGVTHRVEVAS